MRPFLPKKKAIKKFVGGRTKKKKKKRAIILYSYSILFSYFILSPMTIVKIEEEEYVETTVCNPNTLIKIIRS